MSKEIERKYLVVSDSYKELASEKHHIVQANLSTRPDATVRVRLFDDKAFLTVKGRNKGAVRDEWEYPIPPSDAQAMIERCSTEGHVIEKTRLIVDAGMGLKWEIDEFHGHHQGLIVAEIELPEVDTSYTLPDFIGEEVTDDPRYYNSSLAGL